MSKCCTPGWPHWPLSSWGRVQHGAQHEQQKNYLTLQLLLCRLWHGTFSWAMRQALVMLTSQMVPLHPVLHWHKKISLLCLIMAKSNNCKATHQFNELLRSFAYRLAHHESGRSCCLGQQISGDVKEKQTVNYLICRCRTFIVRVEEPACGFFFFLALLLLEYPGWLSENCAPWW